MNCIAAGLDTIFRCIAFAYTTVLAFGLGGLPNSFCFLFLARHRNFMYARDYDSVI